MAQKNHKTAFVIGSGSWGTALAIILSEHFDQVVLYGRTAALAEEITLQHSNSRYLPEVSLPENIVGSTDLTIATDAQLILSVVPTSATRATAEKLSQLGISESTPIVTCSKGIERGTGDRMSQIIADYFPNNPIGVHSGPTHAEEVSKKLATCAVVACQDQEVLPFLQEVLTTSYARTYTSDDIAGIELGGALKNVFALAAGMASGLGLGDNAIAALVTRGLTEMTRLGVALGGKTETFSGLSGLGDLMVTCYSRHSRNNRVGMAIGQGATCEEACEKLGMVVEGVPNTLSIYESARDAGVDTPIIDEVYLVLYEDKPVKDALAGLLGRALRPEV